MKINDVRILNWTGPEFWDYVRVRPDDPTIEAVITMTLSWSEYKELLDKDKASHTS